MSPRDKPPHLNANQRRSIEALLESVETTLHEIERLMPDSTEQLAGVTTVSNDLPAEFAHQAPAHIAELRQQIHILAERIHLSRRKISKRRAVLGMLTAQLVRLEDITPARLRSYGEVQPGFAEEIAPGLTEIRASLYRLLDIVKE